ncbi:MAG: hypothetical protein ACRD2L_02745, partial [Terriglobia bacterium]
SGIRFNPLVQGPDGPTPEGGWDAIYSGLIVFEIDKKWELEGKSYDVDLWVFAEDKGGHPVTYPIGAYTMDENCDGE